MKYRTLEIDLLSAKELHNVNLFDKMVVYAVFSISGGGNHNDQKTKSTADRDGGSHPIWNFPMKFVVDEAELQVNRLTLDIKLVCARALGDKPIGEVRVQIKDLLDSRPPKASSADGKLPVSYQVRRPNGKPKGVLNVSYRFSDIATGSPAAAALQYGSAVPSAPPMEYFCTAPAPAYQAGQIPSFPQPAGASHFYQSAAAAGGNYYQYPPPPGYVYPAATPPPRYAYEAAPPATYGYPATPPPGYWYQAQAQAQAQPGYYAGGYQAAAPPPPAGKSKLGLGLGAGLVGGIIGGLAFS